LNCFTPVASAVETRLKGGNRLVSRYGANPAAPADGAPDDELGDGAAVGDWEAVADGDGDAEDVGGDDDGLADGAALAVADGAGGPPAWHDAPLMRQSAGWPAWPDDEVTKPTETDRPGWMVASQLSLVTVTWPASSV
jgi:hypothetical protein